MVYPKNGLLHSNFLKEDTATKINLMIPYREKQIQENILCGSISVMKTNKFMVIEVRILVTSGGGTS